MIAVLTPANMVTGGPEALHQLADSVARLGVDGGVLYWPCSNEPQVPAPYRHYQLRLPTRADLKPGDTVVIPEIWPHLAMEFPKQRCLLWWLSLDNFFAQGNALSRLPGITGHLAQSYYAQRHLAGQGIASDLLCGYVNRACRDAGAPREAVVVTNAIKAGEFLPRFRTLAPDIEVRPLSGLSASEVVHLLQRVMVYVDFGHHPGKDRMPRESAACGAVVFTRNAGAASVYDDVPIDDVFRFDGDDQGLLVLAEKVRMVFGDFGAFAKRQDSYRCEIAGEKDEFDAQVAHLLRRTS